MINTDWEREVLYTDTLRILHSFPDNNDFQSTHGNTQYLSEVNHIYFVILMPKFIFQTWFWGSKPRISASDIFCKQTVVSCFLHICSLSLYPFSKKSHRQCRCFREPHLSWAQAVLRAHITRTFHIYIDDIVLKRDIKHYSLNQSLYLSSCAPIKTLSRQYTLSYGSGIICQPIWV